MKLRESLESDFVELGQWFKSKEEALTWGGPKINFPFAHQQLIKDLNWPETPSYSLIDNDGHLAGFIQVFDRFGNNHLGRVAIHPNMRGKGLGKKLMTSVFTKVNPGKKLSLYVVKNNLAAVNLYQRLGFVEVTPPENYPLMENCLYMEKPALVNNLSSA
ncbi:GNAT family N-acetyltransferase [Aliikangiella coralliicola]|uniref:GNAT family N-acetyltransferase n=1 Tax=Aliikangiella coralliicola TaxID=2592383 RepID=A0A545TV17_9GAMM|nr:GNAT family N-acetyltransferase [Aliikangiella coralliicola]TQV81049.1 GNAT family N-acetyltransferase [Aliikangiella coralliicola]